MNILVSACLCGAVCRYDGKSAANNDILRLKDKYNLIQVCPEVIGGLPIPREPCEICGGNVMTRTGRNVTENFIRGAEQTLAIAQKFNCKYAILKERSPSCGYLKIYDGTFSGTVTDGSGITAKMLAENNIIVIGESRIEAFTQC